MTHLSTAALVACALLGSSLPSGSARAQAKPRSIVNLAGGMGAVTFSDGSDGPVLPSFTAQVGIHFKVLRLGAGLRLANSTGATGRGLLVAPGIFASVDMLHFHLDTTRSVGVFVALEPGVRLRNGPSERPALPLPLFVGLRALGFFIAAGGGPVFEWPGDVSGARLGWTLESRIGVEVLELVRFCTDPPKVGPQGPNNE